MDNRHLMLELLKIRADVIKAAMNSNIDEFYVRCKLTELVEDLRDICIDLSCEEEEKDER